MTPTAPNGTSDTSLLQRACLTALLIGSILSLLYFGSQVLVPVAIAVLIWFLLNAMATGLQRLPGVGRRLPRSLALALSAGLVLVTGVEVLQLTIRTVSDIAPRFTEFQNSLNPVFDRLADEIGLDDKRGLNQVMDGLGLEKIFRYVVAAMISFTSQSGIILLYVVFLLIDQQFFEAKLKALVADPGRRAEVVRIARRISRGIQRYVWVMTYASLLTAGLSYAVMWWMGLDQAVFWAATIFFLNFIPTIGSILATVMPVAMAVLQFQDLQPALILLLAIGAIQFVIGNVLVPRMTGNSLNLSLVAVMLSLFVWGALWGVTGMLLAVPITAIMVIVMANFDATRPYAIILSRTGDVRADME